MGFLDARDLQQLNRYKYVSGAYTPLDNLLNPFYIYWNSFFPSWMAPNLITLLGLLFSVSSTAVYLFYKPDFHGDAPSWVYVYGSLCVFLYMSFDFMDGKQARRLGVSGPLGELFDHGCDALNTLFMIVNMMCAFNLGAGHQVISTCLISFFFFSIAQIVEYKSGVLLSNTGYFGVSEVQLFVALFHLMPAIFGGDCYSFELPAVHYSFHKIYQISMNLFAIPGALYMIYQCFTTTNYIPLEERGNVKLSTWDMMKITEAAILFFSPSGTFFKDPVVVTFLTGFSFALITTKIIICHVAKKNFHWFQLSNCILFCLIVADYASFPYIHALYYVALILQLGFYLRFVSTTIMQITTHLNIYCFSVRKKQT